MITSRSPPNSQRICRHAPHGGVGAAVSATTTTRRKRRCPSEIALNMATRSAQIVSPYVAFSTLQPVMIVPSDVSSAAPTLNPENAAWACRRARRAAAISARASEPGKDFLQQSDERTAHATGGLHHFLVVEDARQDTSRHVRDARDAEH